MQELKAIYNQNPLTQKIDLSRKGIRDSDNVFSVLENFPELKEVHLSGNQITSIEQDLSGLENLRYLDRQKSKSNNLVEEIKDGENDIIYHNDLSPISINNYLIE